MIPPFDFTNAAVREIGSGVWFVVSLVMTLVYVNYALGYARSYKEKRWTTATIAAIALAFFCAGSTLRALVFWLYFMYSNNGWNLHIWMLEWHVFAISIILNVLGGAWCVWVFSADDKRIFVAALLLALSVTVPVGMFYVN